MKMKKLIAVMLATVLALSLTACAVGEEEEEMVPTSPIDYTPVDPTPTGTVSDADVMTYAEFIAADMESEVTVDVYVQATQSWWENAITVYAQDPDGGYFIYGMTCSEADAAKLVPGTKIRVSGVKSEWSGETEIVDATFLLLEDEEPFIAEATDVTDLIGKDELQDAQNKLVTFKGMTVDAVSYKNDQPGSNIYVDVSKGNVKYGFCVEAYLTGPDTEVYAAVGELKVGDTVDLTGFLYWYESPNLHITAVAEAE